MVPVACWPLVTGDGATPRLSTVGGATVRFAVRVSPCAVAVRVASCSVAVGEVVICTVADESPLPTVTADEESCATFDVTESETSKPLFPAGPESTIVAVAVLPPASVEGLKMTEESEGWPACARSTSGVHQSAAA